MAAGGGDVADVAADEAGLEGTLKVVPEPEPEEPEAPTKPQE